MIVRATLPSPQKLDSISRKRKDFRGLSFFGEIALLLIDEVHLLSDPRGAALEAIVSRLKMLARYPEMKEQPIFHIRFVAVSATIPNVEDIGAFCKTCTLTPSPLFNKPTLAHPFSSTPRSVSVAQIIHRYIC